MSAWTRSAARRLRRLLPAIPRTPTHRLGHRIQDLSGGERQRTAICRALMNRPRLLLADEPTGSLDERNGEVVFALLRDLAGRHGLTVLLATHERRFAEACHRIIRVRDGRLDEIAV